MRAADRLRVRVARWLWRGETSRWGAAASAVLVPAEAIFRLIVAGRNAAFDRGAIGIESAPIPVISVGNLTVGGSGKTPVGAWIAARLCEMGERPAIVLRGYGKDEIAVHRRLNPGVTVIAAERRIVGVRAAVRRSATCAVLDDAFQHRRLARDIDLVLIAAEGWGRTQRLLPRGPFREPMSSLARAHQILVTRKTADVDEARAVIQQLRDAGVMVPTGIIHLTADGLFPITATAKAPAAMLAPGRQVLALTSLAEPAPFLDQLRRMGMRVEHLDFPDHHDFTDDELREIVSLAGEDPIVMTLKEAVKLQDRWPTDLAGFVLRQRVVVEEGLDTLDELLSKAMGRSR